MTDVIDLAAELRGLGLKPSTWAETLADVQARITPQDFEKFSRAHKNFIGYRSESTLSRFYGTVFGLRLQDTINGYRFGRLVQVLQDLLPEVASGQSVLDVGAGGGYISTLVVRHCAPVNLVVQDSCVAVQDELRAQGFTVLPHPLPALPTMGFDLIFCVDSLGEVNADDDGMLSKPGGIPAEDLPEWMEQRYGFAQKLDPWKAYLAPKGRILVWEPFAYREAYQAVAMGLSQRGWNAEVRSRSPGRNYLELHAIDPLS